jgi:hypothetical protein
MPKWKTSNPLKKGTYKGKIAPPKKYKIKKGQGLA